VVKKNDILLALLSVNYLCHCSVCVDDIVSVYKRDYNILSRH